MQPGQVGDVPIHTARSDFQQFDVPAFDGAGKLLSQFGQGLRATSDAAEKYQQVEDKRNLARYNAGEAILRSQLDNALKDAEGQERLNLIRGTQPAGPPGTFSGGVRAVYDAGVAELKAQYGDVLSADSRVTMELSAEVNSQMANVTIAEQAREAQAAVDTELMATRVATATANAIAAIGTSRSEFVFNNSMDMAAYSVIDSDLGLAQARGITDKETIDLMVQQAQALVITGMVDSLLADGKEVEASLLIDIETGREGHITNSTEASKLRAVLLPYRQDIEAQKNFADLLASVPKTGPLGGPSLAAMTTAVANEPNRLKQAGLERQLGQYTASISAKLKETISQEMQAAMKAIMNNQSVTLAMIPTLAQQNPPMARVLLTGGGFADPQVGVDAANQTVWEADGGGRAFNQDVDIMMTNLQKSNPSQWLAVVRGGHLKGLIDLDQNTSYQKLVAVTQLKADNARAEDRVDLHQLLTDIGITGGRAAKSVRSRLITKYGSAITAAVNSVRTPALDADTKPDYKDIVSAAAQELVRVRTDESIFGDTYDHAASLEVISMGGDPRTMILETTKRNIMYIAAVFGVDPGTVKESLDFIEPQFHTLRAVSANLGIYLPDDPDGKAAQFTNTLHTLSVQEGLPAGFIEFLMANARTSAGKSYNHTPDDLIAVMTDWEKRLPSDLTKEQVFEIWLDQL